jgi:hypothetical protein
MLAEAGQHRMRVGLEVGERYRTAEREDAAAVRGPGGSRIGHTGHPADGSAAGRADGPTGRAQGPPRPVTALTIAPNPA